MVNQLEVLFFDQIDTGRIKHDLRIMSPRQFAGCRTLEGRQQAVRVSAPVKIQAVFVPPVRYLIADAAALSQIGRRPVEMLRVLIEFPFLEVP